MPGMSRCAACPQVWTGGLPEHCNICPGCGYDNLTGLMPKVRPDGSPNPPAPANVAVPGWLAYTEQGLQPGYRMAYFDPRGPEGGTFHYTGRAFVPGQNGA